MLIDTHSHFDDASFDADRDAAWQRALNAGVRVQVVPAVTAADWPRVRETCRRYAGLYPAYGLHPMYSDVHTEAHLAELERWLTTERPVAIGECGLDFYIENPDQEWQRRLFAVQLELARKYDLPVIIHARRSVEEVILTLRRYPGIRGVLHSFPGSGEQARQLIDLGFLMSFGGPITYPNATRLRKLVAELPLTAILLETDAPDQPDADHRGQRNEPAYLPRILQELAALRSEPPDTIADAANHNARLLFGIPA
jgi:TatD DNase family protein